MTDEVGIKFKKLIAVISETYDEPFSGAKVLLWWGVFKKFTVEQFEEALYKHISCTEAGMFNPKPANIIKFITGTTKDIEQAASDRAELAWSIIERDISRIGGYGSLKLDDKQALAAVKAIGGWGTLCSGREDQLTWKKKEFISSYLCYERTPIEDLPKSLPGYVELAQHKRELNDTLASIGKLQVELPKLIK